MEDDVEQLRQQLKHTQEQRDAYAHAMDVLQDPDAATRELWTTALHVLQGPLSAAELARMTPQQTEALVRRNARERARAAKRRTEEADRVGAALLDCFATLKLLSIAAARPDTTVPFDDNIRRALAGMDPLHPALTRLLYNHDEPQRMREEAPVEWGASSGPRDQAAHRIRHPAKK